MRKWMVAMLIALVAVAGIPVSAVGAAVTPAAPQIAKVETVRGAATLHWSPVSGAAGYNVYRNGRYLKTLSGGATKSYRDGNTPAVYKYYITAFDSTKQNFSTKSNEVNADTRGSSVWPASSNNTSNTNTASSGSLGTPSLSKIDTVRGAATLHWSPVSGAAGYNVYRNGRYLKTLSGGATNSYRDGNSPAVYKYYITAFDSAKKNFSPKSNELTADTRGTSTTGSTTTPTASTNAMVPPTVTKIVTARGSATFTFNPVAGAGGYNVYRNGRYLQTISSSPYRDGNTPGLYSYEFVSFDVSKKVFSSKSAKVQVDTRYASTQTGAAGTETSVAASALAAPKLVQIESFRGSAKLSWTNVPGAAGYNVYRNGSYLKTVTRAPYTDRNSPAIYRYQVVAFDASKKVFSAKSNELVADTRSPGYASSLERVTSPVVFKRPGRNILYFTDAKNTEITGWNIERNGVYWKTIKRVDGRTRYGINDWAPGNRVVYGIIPVNQVNGTQFGPRREVVRPVDVRDDQAGLRAADQLAARSMGLQTFSTQTRSAVTASSAPPGSKEYKAQVAIDDALEEQREAHEQMMESNDQFMEDLEKLDAKVEVSGSVEASLTPEAVLSGKLTLDGNAADAVRVGASGAEAVEDRIEYNKAAERTGKAVDDLVSCASGGSCPYQDDPPQRPTGGGGDEGCESNGSCPPPPPPVQCCKPKPPGDQHPD